MSDDVATWTAAQLAHAIRAKQVSSVELLELCLRRTGRLGGPTNGGYRPPPGFGPG